MEELAPLLSAALLVVAVAASAALLVHAKRRMTRVEGAWRILAGRRGYSVEKSTSSTRPGFGRPPLLRGNAGGVDFEITLSGNRDWSETQVSATFTAPRELPVGAEILPETIDPEARGHWFGVTARRSGPILRVWPLTEPARGSHRIVAGWRGLEEDPEVLELAISTVTALVRRFPSTVGAGVDHVPYWMRR